MAHLMKWTDAMSVGVETLDEDHRQLIHLINNLAYADADFAEVFNRLLDYITSHFEREEAHLEALGYPGIDSHRAQHDAFADRVGEMLRHYRESGFDTTDGQVSDFLWTWLKSHILIEDMKYAIWARARQAS